MKNTFGLISRPDMAKKRISNLEDISIESSYKKAKTDLKKIFKDCGTTTESITNV